MIAHVHTHTNTHTHTHITADTHTLYADVNHSLFIWKNILSQGSKFHWSVSPGQMDFPPDNKITNFCCPSDNPGRGSRLRHSSDFGARFECYSVTPIASGLCLVLFIAILIIRNAAEFSQRRPLSSMLGNHGISRCYCTDWLLSSCSHRISRSSGQPALVVRVDSVCVFFL